MDFKVDILNEIDLLVDEFHLFLEIENGLETLSRVKKAFVLTATIGGQQGFTRIQKSLKEFNTECKIITK